ncbi:MAG: helix-turn-helix domain-containing protein [Acidobacteria bacterium]|nr:helix-turn-helix domain-containing protein [Acidobacteriota bacterium]
MTRTIQTTYRYRLDPTVAQETQVNQFAGARRFVWNWALNRKREHFQQTGKTLSFAALAAMLGFFAVGLRAPSLAWQTCTTCGIAFDLGGVLQDEPTCTACSHVISRREGLAPAAREEQIRRIDRYMGLLGKGRAIGQVLWPGTAVVHEGRAGLGLIEMSLFVLLVLMAALAAHPLPGGPLNALWTPGTVPVAMAALLWLIFQMPGLRPRAPGTSRGR